LGMVTAGERLLESVHALERGARSMHTGVDSVVVGATKARKLGPDLSAALSHLDLGNQVETDLLDQLEQARQDLKDAAKNDELTASTQAMVQEIMHAAEESKSRIRRMIAAAESTAETLRNS
jgi:DNA repair ATPase RecN